MYQDEKAMRQLPKEEFGRIHGNNGLRPTSEARTVRKTSVLDGPFAETKEQLAGYFLLEVPDMEAALSWAKRVPTAADGAVEVRPVWT
jgi:hypothetical protein